MDGRLLTCAWRRLTVAGQWCFPPAPTYCACNTKPDTSVQRHRQRQRSLTPAHGNEIKSARHNTHLRLQPFHLTRYSALPYKTQTHDGVKRLLTRGDIGWNLACVSGDILPFGCDVSGCIRRRIPARRRPIVPSFSRRALCVTPPLNACFATR